MNKKYCLYKYLKINEYNNKFINIYKWIDIIINKFNNILSNH